MANYCVAEDVQVLIGQNIAFNNIGSTTTGGTKPTLTQLNSIIADITNEIDLQLSVIGITAQPTDARLLAKLKNGCVYGSAARAGFGTLNMSGSTGDTKPKTYWDMYQAFLKEMLDNPEIFGITADSESVSCGYNTKHTEAENAERLIQQDWKS